MSVLRYPRLPPPRPKRQKPLSSKGLLSWAWLDSNQQPHPCHKQPGLARIPWSEAWATRKALCDVEFAVVRFVWVGA
ncbi:MAG: hypothetical protein H6Q11_998, partial [Acidobacteria bacterium]|nr:hypothetical protein [Acidobacteriota bacterium]